MTSCVLLYCYIITSLQSRLLRLAAYSPWTDWALPSLFSQDTSKVTIKKGLRGWCTLSTAEWGQGRHGLAASSRGVRKINWSWLDAWLNQDRLHPAGQLWWVDGGTAFTREIRRVATKCQWWHFVSEQTCARGNKGQPLWNVNKPFRGSFWFTKLWLVKFAVTGNVATCGMVDSYPCLKEANCHLLQEPAVRSPSAV